jgi:hypothetical protein
MKTTVFLWELGNVKQVSFLRELGNLEMETTLFLWELGNFRNVNNSHFMGT